MADFHLWSKENLVKFAEAATEKLKAQEQEIKTLEAQVKTLHLAWKNALRDSVSSATLPT